MSELPQKVAIVGGARIPFCRSNTAYSTKSNKDMLTASFEALVNKYGLEGERLGEVAAGAVLKHSKDFNLTRESVLSTALDPHTSAFDVQQACGTGLEAAICIGNKIALGQIDSGIAGGTDTTSDAPIVVSEGLRKLLLELNRARSTGDRLKTLAKFRPGMLAPGLPSVMEPRTQMSMGEHCEVMAKDWGVTRQAQDELAFASHKKAAAAYEAGFYDDLVFEYAGVSRDNNMRPDTTLEKLSTLKPAFDRNSGQGTLTAGNSTPLSDGASAVLLGSDAWAKAHDLPVQAYLTHVETAAVDFAGPAKEGLLMAPTYAVPRMLERAGLTLQDFDFYEIHEAFAAQALCTLAAWDDTAYCKDKLGLKKKLGTIDHAKLNIKGGSVALAHPFAATGGRILGTLAKIVDEAKGGRGLISICAAGGLGVTAIVEK